MILLLSLAAADLVPEPAPARADPPGQHAQAATSSRALANLASYISDDDYPAEALRRQEQGTVGFLLDIGPDGLVSDCRVLNSSGSASLDEATCRIMRVRPRFMPARDRAGHPVADQFKARIRWVLDPPEDIELPELASITDYPPEALRRREQGRVGFTVTVSPEGRVTDCQITTSSGSEALDRATCELMRSRARFDPARDPAGNPIASTSRASLRWVLPD